MTGELFIGADVESFRKTLEEYTDKEAKAIEDKVQCGYLRAGRFSVVTASLRSIHSAEDMLITCENPNCGRKMWCDFYDGKGCEYRSLEAEDALDKQPDYIPF